jgi:hypothetical protein
VSSPKRWIGRSGPVGWRPGEGLRGLGTLVLLGALLALAPAAASAASFTWAGGSEGTADWSDAANWNGEAAPTTSQAIETLTFPRLESGACISTPETTDACYLSFNNLAGLSVQSLQLDDGDNYLLLGEGIMLGSGGLTATPAASASGGAESIVAMPLALSASQRWSVANRSGGELGETGIVLDEDVTGAGHALTVELSRGPALILENSTEVGPVAIEGADAAAQSIENGLVLFAGELDSADGEPVDLEHAALIGFGAVGALRTEDATLEVGSGGEPAGVLEAASAKLDAASGTIFDIDGSGTVAQSDYSQLTSVGPVELAGPIVVAVSKPSEKGACPVLTPGEQYTFLSTTATLSGTFANAPEGGAEIPIDFTKSCSHATQTMRIAYSRAGGTETVTGTVEAGVVEKREEELKETTGKDETKAKEEAREQEETRKSEAANTKLAEHTREVAEAVAREVTALMKREAELAAKQRAEAARQGVLGSKETSKARTRARRLAKALKQCRKQPPAKRAKCKSAARRRYGSKAKAKRGHGH